MHTWPTWPGLACCLDGLRFIQPGEVETQAMAKASQVARLSAPPQAKAEEPSSLPADVREGVTVGHDKQTASSQDGAAARVGQAPPPQLQQLK